jgi:Uma2 family endonuclease
VEPDISVICDPSKLDEKGCKGAPDFIIEILSPSSARNDLVLKFNLYLKAGVREYWIVDPDANSVQVFILENGRYISASYGDTEKVPVSVLPGLEISLGDVF